MTTFLAALAFLGFMAVALSLGYIFAGKAPRGGACCKDNPVTIGGKVLTCNSNCEHRDDHEDETHGTMGGDRNLLHHAKADRLD